MLAGINRNITEGLGKEGLEIQESGYGILEPPLKYPIQVSSEAIKCQREIEEIKKCIEVLRMDEKQEREKELQEVLNKEQADIHD